MSGGVETTAARLAASESGPDVIPAKQLEHLSPLAVGDQHSSALARGEADHSGIGAGEAVQHRANCRSGLGVQIREGIEPQQKGARVLPRYALPLFRLPLAIASR